MIRRRHPRLRLEEAVVEDMQRDDADCSDGDLGLRLRRGDALPETRSIGDVIGRETHMVRVSPRTARLNAADTWPGVRVTGRTSLSPGNRASVGRLAPAGR
jgi:hypothetical protein